MEKIEIIKEELKTILSEKRYLHSIGVMEKAMELAKIFGEDEEKAAYTGLVHDIAKEMTEEQLLEYANKNDILLTKEDKIVSSMLHGIVGADIVKQKYGFTKEMQDAIYYHTTGRENMTLLDKIVYVADKSEERTRNSEHANKLREITKKKGLEEAFLFVLEDWTIPKSIEKRKIIHPNSIYARNDIISKLKPEN